MKTIKEYYNTQGSFMGSLSTRLDYPMPMNEEQVFIRDGRHFDGILYKMQQYTENLRYNIYNINANNGRSVYLTESLSDIRFNIEEEIALRDLFVSVSNKYLESLYADYCNLTGEIFEANGIKDFVSKVSKKAQEAGDKLKSGLKKIAKKAKAVYDFLTAVTHDAIKSAKDLVNKFLSMLEKTGEAAGELIKRIGGTDDDYDYLLECVQGAMKNEKTAKDNIYESIGEYLSAVNDDLDAQILEAKILDKIRKKKNDADDADDAGEEPGVNEKTYGDAIDAHDKNGKKGMLKGALKQIFIQVIAYCGVCIVLPAIIYLIGGPVAGYVATIITKVLWSCRTMYKQIKRMHSDINSSEWKTASKFKKMMRWLIFFIGMALTVYGGANNTVKEIGALQKYFNGGDVTQLMPAGLVEKFANIMNKMIKGLTGENAPGIDKMLDAQAEAARRILEISETAAGAAETAAVMSQAAKDEASEFCNDFFKGVSSSKFLSHMKDNWDEIQGHLPKGYNYFSANVKYSGGIKAVLEKLPEGKEWLSKFGDAFEKIPIQSETGGKATYAALYAFKDGEMGREAMSELLGIMKAHTDVGAIVELGSTAAAGLAKAIVSTPMTILKPVTNTLASVLGASMAIKWFKNGGFKVRLGSSSTNVNYIYDIDGNGVKEMTWAEAVEKFGGAAEESAPTGVDTSDGERKDESADWHSVFGTLEYGIYEGNDESDDASEAGEHASGKSGRTFKKQGPPVQQMDSIMQANLKAVQKELNDLHARKTRLDKKERKRYNALVDQEKALKSDSKKCKVIVFYTNKYPSNVSKKDETWHDKDGNSLAGKKLENPMPVMLINPMLMACADLAPSRHKGGKQVVRTSINYFKGLFKHYEFLPIKDGMSIDKIVNMFVDFAKKSVAAAYAACPYTPVTKEGKKYVPVDDAASGNGKNVKHIDFGNFTNVEIADILNNPDDIGKYLDNASMNSHSDDDAAGDAGSNESDKPSEKMRERKLKKYTEIINNDDDVKEYIKNSKTLDGLLDDEGNVDQAKMKPLLNCLTTSEMALIKGKRKKSLWSRIKSFFNGDSENHTDSLDNVDPNELVKLSYMLSKRRTKEFRDKNRNISDSMIQVSYSSYILEQNMHDFINEFEDFWNGETYMFEDNESDDLLMPIVD